MRIRTITRQEYHRLPLCYIYVTWYLSIFAIQRRILNKRDSPYDESLGSPPPIHIIKYGTQHRATVCWHSRLWIWLTVDELHENVNWFLLFMENLGTHVNSLYFIWKRSRRQVSSFSLYLFFGGRYRFNVFHYKYPAYKTIFIMHVELKKPRFVLTQRQSCCRILNTLTKIQFVSMAIQQSNTNK